MLALAACQMGPVAAPPLGPVPVVVATVEVAGAPASLAVAGGVVYVSSAETGALQALDAMSGRVAATVDLGGAAAGDLLAFPDQKTLLVCDTRNAAVLVVDPAQNHRVVQRVAVGPNPRRLIVDADDNQTVFVATDGPAAVTRLRFDRDDRAVPPATQAYTAPGAPGAGYAYAFGQLLVGGTRVFDTGSGAVTELSTPSAGPMAVGVSLGAARAMLVADPATGAINVHDRVNNVQAAVTGAGTGPADAAVDAESALAYFTMAGSNEVAVIDYIRRQLVSRIAVGAKPGRIDPAPALPVAGYRVLHGIGGHELWVSNDEGASVSVLDGARLAVSATIAVGRGPHAMAFSGARAYVANALDGTVSVIDRQGGPQ